MVSRHKSGHYRCRLTSIAIGLRWIVFPFVFWSGSTPICLATSFIPKRTSLASTLRYCSVAAGRHCSRLWYQMQTNHSAAIDNVYTMSTTKKYKGVQSLSPEEWDEYSLAGNSTERCTGCCPSISGYTDIAAKRSLRASIQKEAKLAVALPSATVFNSARMIFSCFRFSVDYRKISRSESSSGFYRNKIASIRVGAIREWDWVALRRVTPLR